MSRPFTPILTALTSALLACQQVAQADDRASSPSDAQTRIAEQQPAQPAQADNLPVVHVTAQPISAVESVLDIASHPRPQAQADGADYLKNLAGFNAVRKGGVDADPVLRGAGGSRLAILLDGAPVMGGCSNRMDPPTAYVFPDTFDRVRIIKGPQTVAYGPGIAAGAVLFESNDDALAHFSNEAEFDGRLRTLAGSFARNEQLLQLGASTERVALGLQANRASMNNYRDADGERVASAYHKQAWELNAAAKLAENTVLALQLGKSAGEAAYADRHMDGSQFDRDYAQLRLTQLDLNDYWRSSELQLATSRVDHVMDNYSLRDEGWLGAASAMNPRRANDKLRWHNQFEWGNHSLQAGVDAEKDRHQSRMSMNQRAMPYQQQTFADTVLFERQGIYAEWRSPLSATTDIVTGARVDRARARDQRQRIGGHHHSQANPSAKQARLETLNAHFVRLEHNTAWSAGQASWFIGWGQSERLPDYWELISKESTASLSAFNLPVETHRQWDAGFSWTAERSRVHFSVFAADIDNYALIDSRYPKTVHMMGMAHTRLATVSRPVQASSYGAELTLEQELAGNWWTQATLAYVHASNLSDHRPLPQQPPLELQWTLEYRAPQWQAGALWRVVDRQHRIAVGEGSIAGVDTGTSTGFATLGLYASWQASSALTVSAGVDNLFNRQYHEHLARPAQSDAALSLARIAEPGRSWYLSLDYRF